MNISNHSKMDWSILRDFIAVAETGSLSQAARRLRVSQPTLSRRIAQLELQLKAQLFQRTPRGLLLTDAGESVLAGARRVEEEALAIERQADAAQQTLTGTVRLSVTEMLGTMWLPKQLAAFHGKYPGVCVEVLVDNRAANLMRREADIAMRLFRPDQPDLIARHVGEVVMGLYGSRDYLAREGTPTTVAHLRHHFLVGFDEGMGTRNKDVQRLERCFMPEKIVHRSSSFIGQLHATQQGIGLGVHDCFIADSDPNLQRLMPDQFEHRMEVWLVTHADMRRSARIRAVYDFLAAALVADHARLTGRAVKKGAKPKAA
ncbi:MAG: LysR family transcriptional regulator [Rhodospirillaceae bacterium]|nr:LysR family transcriptional regulator [Rhodospirillaceae bacterium]